MSQPTLPLDEFAAAFGRRPEYCVPVVNRDLATVLLEAFADAHPLTPRGVRDALERVKMLPAASMRSPIIPGGSRMHQSWTSGFVRSRSAMRCPPCRYSFAVTWRFLSSWKRRTPRSVVSCECR